VSARRDERPTSVRPGNGELQDGYQMDTSKCKHVHKYVTRIKQVRHTPNIRHTLHLTSDACVQKLRADYYTAAIAMLPALGVQYTK